MSSFPEARNAITSEPNTTTTPLGSGETFTGGWSYSPLPDVMVSCMTDNTGTLYFDFSNNNGTNFSTFPVGGFGVEAGTHEFHTALKGPRWFRVRLVNDTGAQSYLRLYTYFGAFPKTPNAPINSTIGKDADATIVRTISTDLEIAFGRFSGISEDAKFGEVRGIDAIDNATDVWTYGDDGFGGALTKTFPSSAQTLYVSSDSTSDTSKVVRVSYIDANGLSQTTDVTLTGQTVVNTGVTALDCNRVVQLTGTVNVGNLYVATENNHSSGTPADPTKVLAHVKPTQGQTRQAILTVPSNKRLRIKGIRAYVSRASGAAGSAIITLREQDDGGTEVVKRLWHVTTSQGVNEKTTGLVFPALAHIRARVEDVSDTDTNVTFEFDYDEIDI